MNNHIGGSSPHVTPHRVNLTSRKVTSHGLNLILHHMHHGIGQMVYYTLFPQTWDLGYPPVPPASDIWVSSLDTYSNLLT